MSNEKDTSVEIVSDLDRMSELKAVWNTLADHAGTPLLRHDWFMACARALCPPGQLHIVILWSEGRASAIAPMVLIRRGCQVQLEILGATELCEPTGFLFADPSSLARLVGVIQESAMPIVLSRIITKPLRTLLNARRKSRLIVETQNDSPWISCKTTWETFEARMRPASRSAIRRMKKRLARHGEVEIALIPSSSPEFGSAFREALRIEAAGWKAVAGTAVLVSHPLRRFFSGYLSAMEHPGNAFVALLKVKGRGVAMVLGTEYNNRLWILKTGYDESWRSCAPGILVLHGVIQIAFERGFDAVEFLGTTERYIETRWPVQRHVYSTFRVVPVSLRGFCWMAVEGTRLSWRKLLHYVRNRKASSLRNVGQPSGMAWST